jgi:hypothetical protein
MWSSKTLPDKVLRLLSPADRRALGKAGLTADEALQSARVKSEKDLQNLIEAYFRLRGIVAFRSRMDKKTRMRLGTPDFLLALRGEPVAIEAKLPGEPLSDAQVTVHEAMVVEPNGWTYLTVCSLDAVKAFVHDKLDLIG